MFHSFSLASRMGLLVSIDLLGKMAGKLSPFRRFLCGLVCEQSLEVLEVSMLLPELFSAPSVVLRGVDLTIARLFAERCSSVTATTLLEIERSTTTAEPRLVCSDPTDRSSPVFRSPIPFQSTQLSSESSQTCASSKSALFLSSRNPTIVETYS